GVAGPSDDGAASFGGGNNDYVTVPNSPALNSSQYTIEAWVNFQGTAAEYSSVVNFSVDGKDMGEYGLGFWYGKFCFFPGSIGGYHLEAPLPTGQWSHVVVTSDGHTTTMYINGLQAAQSVFDLDKTSSTMKSLQIGSRMRSDIDGAWVGSIDDVAIYDRVLTPNAIVAHYQAVARTPATVLNRGNQQDGSYAINLTGADNVTLSNFGVTGASIGVYASPGANSSGLTMVNMDIFGNGTGINLEESNDHAQIVHSKIHGSVETFKAGVGVEAAGVNIEAASATLFGNEVFGNAGVGIKTRHINEASGTAGWFATRVPGLSLIDNVVRDNSGGGIDVTNTPGALIQGNDVYRNERGGIVVTVLGFSAQGNDRVTVTGNRVHDNRGVAGITAVGGRLGGISDGFGEVRVTGNEVYRNHGAGIGSRIGVEVLQNNVHDNEDGIIQSSQRQFNGSYVAPREPIVGNRVYHNSKTGITARP
ncbi:MAG: right-handed parallel beta-helix repeat-containing protein, partial [Planctomycetia bacterium]|nr:right-handed parallel beta-helix repeat-containing protein [Planctomycetia bacterium]